MPVLVAVYGHIGSGCSDRLHQARALDSRRRKVGQGAGGCGLDDRLAQTGFFPTLVSLRRQRGDAGDVGRRHGGAGVIGTTRAGADIGGEHVDSGRSYVGLQRAISIARTCGTESGRHIEGAVGQVRRHNRGVDG